MRNLHRLLFSVKSETSPPVHSFVTRDAAIEIAYGAQFTNRSSVAALAILVYDILLTTDEEVRLIWPKRLSYTKLLYFFIRYFPVLVLISILFVGTEITPEFHFTPYDCFIWQVWQGVAALAVAAAVDIILVLRVYAMYGQSRTVLGILAFAYLLEVSSMVASLILTLPKIEFDTICVVTSIPTTILIYGAASLLFQLMLFIFTMVKLVQGLRMGRVGGRTPLLTLLARDGTWAFGLIFLIIVMQASLYALPEDKHGYIGMFYGWLLVVFSFCGYRILLNIQYLSPTLGDTDTHDRRAPLPVFSSSGAGDSGLAFTSHIGVDSRMLGAGDRSELLTTDDTANTRTESYEMLSMPSSSSAENRRLRHVV